MNDDETAMTHEACFIHDLFGLTRVTCNPEKTTETDGEPLTLVTSEDGVLWWAPTDKLTVGDRLKHQHTCAFPNLCNGTCW